MMETATTSSKDAEFFQLCECKCGALAKNICTEENCAFNQIQPFYCNKGCASRNKHNHLQVTIKQVCTELQMNCAKLFAKVEQLHTIC